jgi:hypothetical protein
VGVKLHLTTVLWGEKKRDRDICIVKFIVALFTVAKLWSQPRNIITDEWIKKMWYIYTMEYCII